MRTSTYPTEWLLVKAWTSSEWDKCDFALVHLPTGWRSILAQREEQAKSLHTQDPEFIKLSYQGAEATFYQGDVSEHLTEHREWTFVDLDEDDLQDLREAESRLILHEQQVYYTGTIHYSAQSKHGNDEYWTSGISLYALTNQQ